MKVLITGASGQLGGALLRTAPANADLNAIDVDDVDFIEVAMLGARLVVEAPEIIINAAAFNDLDAAQTDGDLARAVNADTVAAIIAALEENGGRLVHISCDCVFDGTSAHAYRPADTPNPLSVYGHSKAAGEAHLRPQDLLVRTSWLYEAGGDNFVRTMIKQMQVCDEVTVAADQISAPTWANGLARTIWGLLDRQASGIYHHSDAGAVSRYDFALAIAEEAKALGLIERIPAIRPITAAEDRAPARRPAFSVLDCSATRSFLGDEATEWRTNLRRMLQAEKMLG